MTPHWAWGLSTAIILAFVIWLNSKQIRAGWLLGASVQFINMGFGWGVHGQWTFVFLGIPAGMFLWAWWNSKPQVQARPGRHSKASLRRPDLTETTS
jgi:hypothetical protein